MKAWRDAHGTWNAPLSARIDSYTQLIIALARAMCLCFAWSRLACAGRRVDMFRRSRRAGAAIPPTACLPRKDGAMLAAAFELARPMLFALPPEHAHELTLRTLEAGIYPRAHAHDDARLGSRVW